MKMGPPIIAVTIPIWSVDPTMMNAAMSQMIIMHAPRSADAGSSMRLSEPTKMRAMCGDTSPTNPMMPVKLTIPAAMREMMTRQSMRTLSTLIPRDFA